MTEDTEYRRGESVRPSASLTGRPPRTITTEADPRRPLQTSVDELLTVRARLADERTAALAEYDERIDRIDRELAESRRMIDEALDPGRDL